MIPDKEVVIGTSVKRGCRIPSGPRPLVLPAVRVGLPRVCAGLPGHGDRALLGATGPTVRWSAHVDSNALPCYTLRSVFGYFFYRDTVDRRKGDRRSSSTSPSWPFA